MAPKPPVVAGAAVEPKPPVVAGAAELKAFVVEVAPNELVVGAAVADELPNPDRLKDAVFGAAAGAAALVVEFTEA